MQRRIYPRPRFYLFMIAFMLLCFTVSGVVSQLHCSRIADRITLLTDERLALSNRIQELDAQLDYVRTDAYIERIARDELNMIMPGEIRYISN